MTQGEQWRDIPGYNGWYQASTLGQIRTWHKRSGGPERAAAPLIMKQLRRDGCNSVGLRRPGDGRCRMHTVASLVYRTFVGPIPEGMRVIHKSLDTEDNRPGNLYLGTRRQSAFFLNEKRGWRPPNRRAVLKISLELEVVAAYPSARAADKANHFSNGVVTGYCGLRKTSTIAGDGYIYAWDSPQWLARTFRRAKAELDALGIRYNDPFTARYFDLPVEPDPAPDLEAIQWSDAPALAGGGTISGPICDRF